MKYRCADCKDRGYITLLLSTVECDCRKREPKSTDHKPHGINLAKDTRQSGRR